MLNRFFSTVDMGRQWRAEEELLPVGHLPFCQQGIPVWKLPETSRMVKLIWKSQSELQGTKPRGGLESEDAGASLSGNFVNTVICAV